MRTAGRRTLPLAVLAVAFCCWSTTASAQTDEEFFQTFPLNISNPGARAQAMGGAFIAVADDASAAVTNPAGLANLTRQQAYFEFKGFNAPVAKLSGFTSLLDGTGAVSAPTASLPGFINYARPINDKMTVAFSYHQFLSYKNTFVLDARETLANQIPVFPAVNASVDIRGESFSGAIGYTVASKLKVGGAVSFNRLNTAIDANRSNAPVQGVNGLPADVFTGDPFCGPNTNTVSCTMNTRAANIPSTSIHDTPSKAGFTAGALVQPIESVTLGFVAAVEPHFTLTENVVGIGYPGISDRSWTVPFNVPNHFGGGVAWRLNDRTLTTFDAVYVQYSELVSDGVTPVLFRDPKSFSTIPGLACPTVNPNCLSVAGATVPNGTDIHAGLEYLIVRAPLPIFVRYGFERLAPHIVSAGSCPIPFGPNFNSQSTQQGLGQQCTYQSQLYAGTTGTTIGQGSGSPINLASTEVGYSVGGGLVVGPRAQLDLAYVHTSYHRTDFIASMAVRF